MGGPFKSLDGELLAEQGTLLGLGYDLIVPLYPGTGERAYHIAAGAVSPDFDDGVAELRSVLAWAQESGPVLLVGESYGGLVASALVDGLRSADRLLLMGPLSISVRQAIVRADLPVSPLLYSLVEPDPDSFELPPGPVFIDNQDGLPAEMSLDDQNKMALSLLYGFFGDRLDADPVALFAKHQAPRLLIVARAGDERIGAERIPALLEWGGHGAKSLILPGPGHSGAMHRRELDQFIAEVRKLQSD